MDSGTMVRAAGDEMGTVRIASTMSDGTSTMIEHGDTLPSQLGTMVINAEDEEEEGTMKSKALMRSLNFAEGQCVCMAYKSIILSLLCSLNQKLEDWGHRGGGHKGLNREAGMHTRGQEDMISDKEVTFVF